MKDLSYTSRLLFSVKGFTTYFLEGNIRILICLFYTAFLTEIHSNRDIPYLYLFLVILFRSWAIAMDSQPNRKRSSRWTEREDQYLCYLIQDCKLDNWSEIASQMEHNGFQKRPAHQYRIRWENCLDPTLIKEEWTDEKTAQVTNNGPYETEYSVLRYEWIPHKNLCGYQKIKLAVGETKAVKF